VLHHLYNQLNHTTTSSCVVRVPYVELLLICQSHSQHNVWTLFVRHSYIWQDTWCAQREYVNNPCTLPVLLNTSSHSKIDCSYTATITLRPAPQLTPP